VETHVVDRDEQRGNLLLGMVVANSLKGVQHVAHHWCDQTPPLSGLADSSMRTANDQTMILTSKARWPSSLIF
jgi:hypothetical protein